MLHYLWLVHVMKNMYCWLLQMHVHIKRHLMKEMPETDDAVSQWCKDLFVAKVHTMLSFSVVFTWYHNYAKLKCSFMEIRGQLAIWTLTSKSRTNLPGYELNFSSVFLWLSACLLLAYQDALLDKHIAEDTFSDQELQDTGRPIKSLLVRYTF